MIGLVLAQAVVAAATPAEGVIAYPPAFFSAQQPANAREMLSRIPGFIFDGGADVRGFEGAGGNVLVDGQRPTSKSEGLSAILTRVPASKVARIDIIRGGAPGIDMQGKPVVANVVLKTDNGLRGEVQSNASQLPDGRTVGGFEWRASGASGTRNWETSGIVAKGYSGLLGRAEGLRINSVGGVSRTDIDTEDDGRLFQLTGAYDFPIAGGRLRLNALAYHDDIKFEEDDVELTTGAVASTDQLIVDDSREIGLTFNRPVSARTKLELVGLHQASTTDLSSVFTGGGQQRFGIDRSTREDILRGVLKHRWTERLSGELGVEGAQNRLRSASSFEIDGAPIPLPAARVRVQEDRAEIFAKGSWRVTRTWTVDGQMRIEKSTISASGDIALEKSLTFLKPRVLVAWSPVKSTQVRLRLEREVGQLDFDAFVAEGSLNSATGVTAGNPDLEPERAWTLEAALERRFWSRGAIVLTATHAEVEAVVDRGPVFSSDGVFDRPANIGDGSRDSLRVDLTVPLDRLGLKSAQLRGFVVRRWSEVDDPTTGESRSISAQKRIEWEVKFSQDLPAQDMSWGVELYGGYQRPYYRFNAVDTYKLDPFLMTYVEWRPRTDVNLRLELENITRRGYRQTTLTYDAPRNSAGTVPATISDRNFHFGRIIYIRLRKTFGG